MSWLSFLPALSFICLVSALPYRNLLDFMNSHDNCSVVNKQQQMSRLVSNEEGVIMKGSGTGSLSFVDNLYLAVLFLFFNASINPPWSHGSHDKIENWKHEKSRNRELRKWELRNRESKKRKLKNRELRNRESRRRENSHVYHLPDQVNDTRNVSVEILECLRI